MADLFLDRVLVKNNRDRDELDTEPELVGRLQNRILLLFFGSGACCSCRGFAPTLAHFFRQLTDESYVERSAQLVLLYVRWEPAEPKFSVDLILNLLNTFNIYWVTPAFRLFRPCIRLMIWSDYAGGFLCRRRPPVRRSKECKTDGITLFLPSCFFSFHLIH